VDTVAGTTFFGGHARPAFGHVLLEILPRFWPERDFGSFDQVVFYPTRAATSGRRPQLAPYAGELLNALGIAANQCLELGTRAVTFERLVVSSPAFWLKRGYNPVLTVPFRRAGEALAAVARTDPQPATRVYLSRSRLDVSARRALNEEAIEAIVRDAGFVVVHPQDLPISTQVGLIRAAEVIAACDGSALHLAAFARPGTKLVAFDSRLVPNQLILDEAAQLDALHAYVVDGQPSTRVNHWIANLDRVRTALDTALR
jgi:capsular polysaccharide biosynthesis protein